MDDVKRKIWEPLQTTVAQIVDAIAAIPLEDQLKHQLDYPPRNLNFEAVFRQRHPAAWDALEEAFPARNRAARALQQEQSKQARIAKLKATNARKKAAREAAAARVTS